MLHAEGDLAGDVLLGVLRPDRGEEPLQRGDVARRRRGGHAVVEGHQVRRQRPPARAARAAEPAGVDLGAARQVIEAADAVPDPVARGAPADEQRADADHRVLGRAARARRLPLAVEDLPPFALADRVVAEGRDPVPGEQDAGALVGGRGLAVGVMPAGHQDRGERGRPRRQVEQGRDVVVGAALVNDPFESVTVAGPSVPTTRAWSGVFSGRSPSASRNLPLRSRCRRSTASRRLQGGHRRATGVEGLTRLLVEVSREHRAWRPSAGTGLEHGQALACRRGDGHEEEPRDQDRGSHRSLPSWNRVPVHLPCGTGPARVSWPRRQEHLRRSRLRARPGPSRAGRPAARVRYLTGNPPTSLGRGQQPEDAVVRTERAPHRWPS